MKLKLTLVDLPQSVQNIKLLNNKTIRKHDTSVEDDLIKCTAINCSCVFDSLKSYEEHLAQYHKETKTLSSMDFMKMVYANRCNDIRISNNKRRIAVEYENISEKNAFTIDYVNGFAIFRRKYCRFTVKQKEYLNEIFDAGEKNNITVSAESFQHEMLKKFGLSECLSAKQIKSYFSNLKRKKRITTTASNVTKKEQDSDYEPDSDSEIIDDLADQIISEIADD